MINKGVEGEPASRLTQDGGKNIARSCHQSSVPSLVALPSPGLLGSPCTKVGMAEKTCVQRSSTKGNGTAVPLSRGNSNGCYAPTACCSGCLAASVPRVTASLGLGYHKDN